MRALTKICIPLFSFFSIIACKKEIPLEEVVNRIPIEERCVFTEGDILLYSCSDGSTDTAVVLNVEFKTQTGTTTGFFGGATNTYVTDIQKLEIETFHDKWKYGDVDSRCYYFLTSPEYHNVVENFPRCILANGCGGVGEDRLIIGDSFPDFDEKKFNNKTYKKVYFESRGSLKVYWNLKYGIIRYEKGLNYIWNLEH